MQASREDNGQGERAGAESGELGAGKETKGLLGEAGFFKTSGQKWK